MYDDNLSIISINQLVMRLHTVSLRTSKAVHVYLFIIIYLFIYQSQKPIGLLEGPLNHA